MSKQCPPPASDWNISAVAHTSAFRSFYSKCFLQFPQTCLLVQFYLETHGGAAVLHITFLTKEFASQVTYKQWQATDEWALWRERNEGWGERTIQDAGREMLGWRSMREDVGQCCSHALRSPSETVCRSTQATNTWITHLLFIELISCWAENSLLLFGNFQIFYIKHLILFGVSVFCLGVFLVMPAPESTLILFFKHWLTQGKHSFLQIWIRLSWT